MATSDESRAILHGVTVLHSEVESLVGIEAVDSGSSLCRIHIHSSHRCGVDQVILNKILADIGAQGKCKCLHKRACTIYNFLNHRLLLLGERGTEMECFSCIGDEPCVCLSSCMCHVHWGHPMCMLCTGDGHTLTSRLHNRNKSS